MVKLVAIVVGLVGCRSGSDSKPAKQETGSGSAVVEAPPVDAAVPVEPVSSCDLAAPQNAAVFGFKKDDHDIGAQLLIPELRKICKEQKWSQAFADCLLVANDEAGRVECEKKLKPDVAAALEARVATFVKKLDEWATKAPDCKATADAYYNDADIAKQKTTLSPADRARAMTEMKKLMAARCSKKWSKLLANCVRFNDQRGTVGESGADQCMGAAAESWRFAGYPTGIVSLLTGVAPCDRYLALSKVPACEDILDVLVTARNGLFEMNDPGEVAAAKAACEEAIANAPKGCVAK